MIVCSTISRLPPQSRELSHTDGDEEILASIDGEETKEVTPLRVKTYGIRRARYDAVHCDDQTDMRR